MSVRRTACFGDMDGWRRSSISDVVVGDSVEIGVVSEGEAKVRSEDTAQMRTLLGSHKP